MYDELVHPHGTLRAEEISCNFGDGHGLRRAKIWNDFFLFQEISDESVWLKEKSYQKVPAFHRQATMGDNSKIDKVGCVVPVAEIIDI